jgi:hypothetical protein
MGMVSIRVVTSDSWEGYDEIPEYQAMMLKVYRKALLTVLARRARA